MKKLKDYLHLEEWKPIPNYPNYEASIFGNIRSLDKCVNHNYGGESIKKGKVLSKYINSKGYYAVGVTVNGKTKTTKNAILTCLAWHPNPENKRTVNHIDTDKLNDCEYNLEWNTHRENVVHAIQNNCRKNFKLSDETIKKIVANSNKKVIVTDTVTNATLNLPSINSAAIILNVKQSTVSQALRRNSLIQKKYRVSYEN